MKILVTGANGYIGRHVVNALLDRGCEVIACDVNTEDIDNRANRLDFNLFELPLGNLFEFFGCPDVCLHMAWRNGFIHNSPSHLADLSAHFNFIIRLIDDGLKHAAIMGSMHEIGYWEGAITEKTPTNPISLYGIAKDALRRATALYAEQKGCIYQWLRCYYILGDDKRSSSIFGKILRAEEEGKSSFPFTSGRNKYDFIDVDELSQLIAATILQNDITGIINCCKGEPISLAERVESFIKEHGLKIKLDYGVFPDRPYDSPCIYGDASKINKIIENTNEA